MSATASRDEEALRGARGWLWLQLAIGWIPVWGLYATIMYTMHGGALAQALLVSARAIGTAALLGMLVLRFTERVAWPRPVRPPFVLIHLAAAITFAISWVLSVSLVEGLLVGRFRIISPAGFVPFVALGVWLYVAVAGVSYAVRATERAARAEAAAIRAQLAALRGQLDPHFLFNALHTVVQLIPVSPGRASEAAELLAGLLRSAIQEGRDTIPLGDEIAFVGRYVELERLRFDDRLVVVVRAEPGLEDAEIPAFALQTLVENAVRHGATPRVEPTRITVAARRAGKHLELSVVDDGVGGDLARLAGSSGTGLRRLRERLDALYGSLASLSVETSPGQGFSATIAVPLTRVEDPET
jgi:signal transduction histidine kinase